MDDLYFDEMDITICEDMSDVLSLQEVYIPTRSHINLIAALRYITADWTELDITL